MKVYHFSENDLTYLGTSMADESPLEPGVYLIPAWATEVAPPTEVPPDCIIRFNRALEEWFTEPAPAPEQEPQ